MNIKNKPEDFVVEEVIDLVKEEGGYLYLKLTKTNRNTLDVVNEISKRLGIPSKNIGYAGSKDKKAITTQYLSIKGIKNFNLKLKECKLEVLYRGKKPITLGSLKLNKFKIKIDFTPKKSNFMINYYGEQRFSTNNIEIGKLILKSNFQEAEKIIGKSLKKLNKRMISFYIHAYQSYLWNEVAKDYIKEKTETREIDNYLFTDKKVKNIKIPLFAFDTEFKNKQIERLYLRLIKKEEITRKDFIIKKMPNLSPISVKRDLIVPIKDYQYSKPYIYFALPKGSYATVALRKFNK